MNVNEHLDDSPYEPKNELLAAAAVSFGLICKLRKITRQVGPFYTFFPSLTPRLYQVLEPLAPFMKASVTKTSPQ